MADSKVKQFIQNLGATKLTENEIAIVKAHHEYHKDRQIQIIGALPQRAVFVKVIDHIGYCDSVIDVFCYENDCSEACFIRNASERREINFIKKWLKNNLSDGELQKLTAEGKI
ncbi:hypothetical protein [Pumilibacter intestinalis]|uniref:hypothetical protein n=1 Tax=Pumilibacter intestinalis TaxID=2941511 RepID=UPI00203E192A|nr:hypothetical protein [Pumilibacter intestinalis]